VPEKPDARYPRHVSFVTTNDQKNEIEAIAAEHEMYQGEVLRDLVRRGLVAYYRDGAKMGTVGR
jgi:hypothetical protein